MRRITRERSYLAKHLFSQNEQLKPTHTVIRFVRVSAKFETGIVVSVNGTLVEDKMRRCKGECTLYTLYVAATRVPFTLTTVQVPNLALTHMKRVTVQHY
jgi:hypothetical protein